MEQQVREGHAAQRDAQVVHMGEIGLTSFTWLMPLFEDDILLWPMQRFPLRDVSLQGAHLDRLVPLGMLLTQQRKQRCSLQGWVSLQLRHDPGPVFFKRVRPRPPGAGAFQFAGQLASAFIATGGSLAHACTRGGDVLGGSFVSRLHK